jgi:dihydrofolate reductase
VVVTRQKDWQEPGAVAASSLTQAIADASSTVMVIGGSEIYEHALPFASRIELTEVHRDFEGDARFCFERSAWLERAREDHVSPDGLRYSYVRLERKVP